ncbi:MAG: MBL fold metallo-hydrolase [Dysgonomonas sp.]
MKVETFVFNPVGENTYVVYDETNECIIIDPGCFFPEEKDRLLRFITANNLKVVRQINTHLHFDHVFGCNFIKEQFNVSLEANSEDQFLLDGYTAQLRMFGFPPTSDKAPVIGKFLNEGDVVEFGNQTFSILHVPGHSPGSIVFYNEKEKCLFAGDVLFRQSIGRTDLAGGNHQQLITGIEQKLMKLPDDTLVYSGHGPTTTIGYERINNPYL